jgi:hypothetical protein
VLKDLLLHQVLDSNGGKQMMQRIGSVVTFLLAGLLAAAPAWAQTDSPGTWPREIDIPQGVVVMYQPQPEKQVSMNQGFFYCRSWEGGLHMTMDAVFSVLAGVMFLNELLTWRLFVGGGMIFCGVVVMNLLSARRTGLHYKESGP